MAMRIKRNYIVTCIRVPYPPVIQINCLVLGASWPELVEWPFNRWATDLFHTTRVTVVPIFMQERKVIHNDTTNNSAVEVKSNDQWIDTMTPYQHLTFWHGPLMEVPQNHVAMEFQ